MQATLPSVSLLITPSDAKKHRCPVLLCSMLTHNSLASFHLKDGQQKNNVRFVRMFRVTDDVNCDVGSCNFQIDYQPRSNANSYSGTSVSV